MNRPKAFALRRLALIGLTGWMVLTAARVSHASVVDVTTLNPQIPALLVPAPPSVANNAVLGSAIVFNEQKDVVLSAPLYTDSNGFGHGIPGEYQTGIDSRQPGVIPAGTRVSSFMIHFDIIPAPFGPDTASLILHTDENIIGVILSDNLLDASDPIVGAPGTIYPTGLALRGATVDPTEGNDDIVVGVPGDLGVGYSRSVFVRGLQVGAVMDEVRIITAPVPEPASGILALTSITGFLVCVAVRRRLRTIASSH